MWTSPLTHPLPGSSTYSGSACPAVVVAGGADVDDDSDGAIDGADDGATVSVPVGSPVGCTVGCVVGGDVGDVG